MRHASAQCLYICIVGVDVGVCARELKCVHHELFVVFMRACTYVIYLLLSLSVLTYIHSHVDFLGSIPGHVFWLGEYQPTPDLTTHA